MPSIQARLEQLNIQLPTLPQPAGSYMPAVMSPSGCPVFVSGQLPFRSGELIATGLVPENVSLELAQECARQCVLNGLAALQSEIQSLERVRRVLRLGVFIACGPNFHSQPLVANGASDLMVELFGDAGKHARAAVGVSALPLNAPVEVDFLFAVD